MYNTDWNGHQTIRSHCEGQTALSSQHIQQETNETQNDGKNHQHQNYFEHVNNSWGEATHCCNRRSIV